MQKPTAYCVGIDIAAATFTMTILSSKDGSRTTFDALAQTREGFDACIAVLRSRRAFARSTTIVMESTGVYTECLCHHLYEAGYQRIVVEAATAIHRVFKISREKTDAVDSQQIAEYAWRYYDRLRFWKPRDEAIEDMATYLALREDAVTERTAKKNRLHAFRKKHRLPEHAQQLILQQIERLSCDIKDCDEHIATLIQMHPELLRMEQLLTTIPGVKQLLVANLLVITQGQLGSLPSRSLAKYLGIAPRQYQSGSSVFRKPRSSGHGNPRIRKLLRLAAQSLCLYRQQYKDYYKQKLAQGKAKAVIFNNVANRIIKIICAVAGNGKPYNPNFISIKPMTKTS